MRLLILIFLTGVFACNRASNTRKIINQEAKKLNDSAARVVIKLRDYKKAVFLLDQATVIDSSYVNAYQNKLVYLSTIRPYDTTKIFKTLKTLVRLRPEDPWYLMQLGISHIFFNNDSITAKKYFNEAAISFDKVLDTMHKTNSSYEFLAMNKAFNLIYIGKEKDGKEILQQIYNQESDTTMKQEMWGFINKSRRQILEDLKQR